MANEFLDVIGGAIDVLNIMHPSNDPMVKYQMEELENKTRNNLSQQIQAETQMFGQMADLVSGLTIQSTQQDFEVAQKRFEDTQQLFKSKKYDTAMDMIHKQYFSGQVDDGSGNMIDYNEKSKNLAYWEHDTNLTSKVKEYSDIEGGSFSTYRQHLANDDEVKSIRGPENKEFYDLITNLATNSIYNKTELSNIAQDYKEMLPEVQLMIKDLINMDGTPTEDGISFINEQWNTGEQFTYPISQGPLQPALQVKGDYTYAQGLLKQAYELYEEGTPESWKLALEKWNLAKVAFKPQAKWVDMEKYGNENIGYHVDEDGQQRLLWGDGTLGKVTFAGTPQQSYKALPFDPKSNKNTHDNKVRYENTIKGDIAEFANGRPAGWTETLQKITQGWDSSKISLQDYLNEGNWSGENKEHLDNIRFAFNSLNIDEEEIKKGIFSYYDKYAQSEQTTYKNDSVAVGNSIQASDRRLNAIIGIKDNYPETEGEILTTHSLRSKNGQGIVSNPFLAYGTTAVTPYPDVVDNILTPTRLFMGEWMENRLGKSEGDYLLASDKQTSIIDHFRNASNDENADHEVFAWVYKYSQDKEMQKDIDDDLKDSFLGIGEGYQNVVEINKLMGGRYMKSFLYKSRMKLQSLTGADAKDYLNSIYDKLYKAELTLNPELAMKELAPHLRFMTDNKGREGLTELDQKVWQYISSHIGYAWDGSVNDTYYQDLDPYVHAINSELVK